MKVFKANRISFHSRRAEHNAPQCWLLRSFDRPYSLSLIFSSLLSIRFAPPKALLSRDVFLFRRIFHEVKLQRSTFACLEGVGVFALFLSMFWENELYPADTYPMVATSYGGDILKVSSIFKLILIFNIFFLFLKNHQLLLWSLWQRRSLRVKEVFACCFDICHVGNKIFEFIVRYFVFVWVSIALECLPRVIHRENDGETSVWCSFSSRSPSSCKWYWMFVKFLVHEPQWCDERKDRLLDDNCTYSSRMTDYTRSTSSSCPSCHKLVCPFGQVCFSSEHPIQGTSWFHCRCVGSIGALRFQTKKLQRSRETNRDRTLRIANVSFPSGSFPVVVGAHSNGHLPLW